MAYTKNPTHREAGYLTAPEANHIEEGLEAAATVGDNARTLETPEALKAITAAKAETPSETKAVIVTAIVVLKAEATAFEILSAGKVVLKFKKGAAPTAGDIESFTFAVPAGKTWEYKVTAGALTSFEVAYTFQK